MTQRLSDESENEHSDWGLLEGEEKFIYSECRSQNKKGCDLSCRFPASVRIPHLENRILSQVFGVYLGRSFFPR